MPERMVISDFEPCRLSEIFGVALPVMERVSTAALIFLGQTGKRVWIISGARTRAEQRELQRIGRPTASESRSTHRSCPATGIDISLGGLPSQIEKLTWGLIAEQNGLRWGGGSARRDGVPIDWQHVDAGPRVLT